jgi:hypothetical protein
MKRAKLSSLSIPELVQRFTELAVDQDMALLSGEISKVNKIYDKLEAIKTELKSRPGDQRSALLPLYHHKNKQVQIKAAKATLAIAPLAARAQLQAIKDSGWQPQALDAGMALWLLDRDASKSM